MMRRIIDWLKQNKLLAFLLVIIGYLVYQQFLPSVYRLTNQVSRRELIGEPLSEVGVTSLTKEIVPPPGGYAPAPEVEERLVVRQSTLSLLVKAVAQTQQMIVQKAEELGGYLVDSHLSHPEEAEAVFGTVTVRVPQEKLNDVLEYFRSLAVKVVSENLAGRDVTDEYVDIEARLATLLKTKVKFEAILEQAQKVEDILKVQRELTNLQIQIDNLKGQQLYLEKTAQLSKVTVYLSTDELSLPYAPSEAWRPKVVFKQAVRSLVKAIRKLGTALIWLAVYAVVALPVLVIWLVLRRRKKQSS